jgi:hypothetical protein
MVIPLGAVLANCKLRLSLNLLPNYFIDGTNYENEDMSSFTFVTDDE